VGVVRAAVDTADLVLAEANPRMPRTHGGAFLHVDHIDALVPVDTPLPALEAGDIDEVSAEIDRHVARLIPDGATLQVGIGRIPNAVMAALSERSDLGVHAEVFSDGPMQLVESGVVTSRGGWSPNTAPWTSGAGTSASGPWR